MRLDRYTEVGRCDTIQRLKDPKTENRKRAPLVKSG